MQVRIHKVYISSLYFHNSNISHNILYNCNYGLIYYIIHNALETGHNTFHTGHFVLFISHSILYSIGNNMFLYYS